MGGGGGGGGEGGEGHGMIENNNYQEVILFSFSIYMIILLFAGGVYIYLPRAKE